MAFNPFHWFRKRQKVFLAGLVVLCMVIFIFQFGQGDLFTRALGWFGQNRQGGEVVTTLSGKKVYESDLERLAHTRRLASDFLFMEVYEAHPQALEEMLKGPLKSSGEPGPMQDAEDVARAWQRRLNRGLVEPLNRDGALSLLHSLRNDLRKLEEMASREGIKDSKERLEVLNRLSTILGFQTWLITRSPNDLVRIFNQGRVLPPEEFYFGGTRRVDDLLDFLVMKQQADKLGIKLTDEDVLREVSNEAAGVALFESSRFGKEKRVLEFLQNNRVYATQGPKDLLEALRDEMRVAMAKQILLGHVAISLPPVTVEGKPLDEGLRQAPGFAFIPSTLGVRSYRGLLWAAGTTAVTTPDEFLNYYREQTTALRVKVLPVPAEKFVGQVKATPPTEEELRARFEKYRKVEPIPGSRDPGFKEPRRVAVEGLLVRIDTPAALKLGRQGQQVAQALAPLGNRQPLAAVSLVVFDPIRAEYESYRALLRAGQAPPGQDPRLLDAYSRQLRQTSPLEIYSRPFTARRLLERNAWLHTVGAMGMATQGLASLPGALTSLFAQPYLRTMSDHGQAQAMAVVSLFDPHGVSAVVGTVASADLTPVPLAALRPVLERHLDQEMAGRLARAALKQLKKDLSDLPAGSEAKARELIAKVAGAFGAETFTLPAATTATDLQEALKGGDAKGLDALRQSYFRSEANNMMFMMRGLTPPTPTNETFVRWLYSRPAGAYKPTTPAPDFGAGPVEELALSNSSDLLYFWFTQDKAAYEPSFAQARAAVEASWRLEQARQLAMQKAQAIEGQINGKNLTPEDAERVLREQGLGEPFALDNVAPLARSREVLFLGAANYKPYQVPEDLRSQFAYPPQDLARQLQVLKRPGDATVIADLPSNTFYVAVLLARDEPSVQQFREVYANAPRLDPLFDRLLQQRSYEQRQALLVQLRREAGEVDNSGRFKVPAEVRTRLEAGRQDDS